MPTGTPPQPNADGLVDLVDLVNALAPVLADPSVAVDGEGAGRTVTVTAGDRTVTLTEEMLTGLPALVALGKLASTVTSDVARHASTARERRIADARAETMRALENPTADQFGLVDTAHGWVLPESPEVVVTPLPRPDRAAEWGAEKIACRLAVTTTDGVRVGTVTVDWDRYVTSVGEHALTTLRDDLIGSARRRELVTTRPWNHIALPKTNTVPDHVAALASVAADVAEWVQAMDAAVADEETARATRAAEAAEWMRLSRSKDRIPTAALNAWMKKHSHVDHEANGLPRDGYRVVAKQVVGRTRPRHMDPEFIRGGRRKSAGVTEVLYVAKLVYESVRWRGDNDVSYHSFYASQVEELRETLPGCVVKVPDDGKAVFVALDTPEYVQALDAALVEHVLLGGAGN